MRRATVNVTKWAAWMAQLRSRELKLAYSVRLWGLALATLTILIGAVMVFAGLQGSFDWAVEAPHTVSAKLTNASPGIIFATIGMVLCFVVVLQKPIRLQTADDGTLAMHQPLPFTTVKLPRKSRSASAVRAWRESGEKSSLTDSDPAKHSMDSLPYQQASPF